mmetsp:Transcript_72005/g.150435  ORF Transcript_72005/g.150435 Transcript_72005/m.150435 type:complete len:223 (+) Transcript_72005:918-1586(+)
MAAVSLQRESRARSAYLLSFSGLIPVIGQVKRNASPTLCVGDPKNSLMVPWTKAAIRFTKTITCSWRISVVSVKFRMLAMPKITRTVVPGRIAFNTALSPPRMFWAMILAPASPKPRASSEPILMIVFSRTTVSMGSGWLPREAFLNFLQRSIQYWTMAHFRRNQFFSSEYLLYSERDSAIFGSDFLCRTFCSWCLSWSPIDIAARGLFLIFSTFAIIRSMG